MSDATTLKRWGRAAGAVVALAAPVWLLARSGDAGFGAVAFLFSGAAFADRPLVIGGALDQFSLHKELFLFGYSLAVLFPCLAAARWLGGRAPRGFRRWLAAASLVLLVHPLSILAIFAWDVTRYMMDMGVTPRRLEALAAAAAGLATVTTFGFWVGRAGPAGAGRDAGPGAAPADGDAAVQKGTGT